MNIKKEVFPDTPEFIYELRSCKVPNIIPPISAHKICHALRKGNFQTVQKIRGIILFFF